MNSNIKTLAIVLISLAFGLGAGYFLFGQSHEHQHQMPVKEATTNASATNTVEEIWTCSMHPQVRQNEFGLCPLCEMDLIPLETNASSDPLVLQMSEDAVQLANIQTSVIGRSTDGQKSLRLSGKVQADERLASSLVAHVPGRIEKLFVSFTGEQVNRGQALAVIYAPELITAQRELLEALKLASINPGLLDAARNKLRFWKVGEATVKAIEEKGTIQETFTLYADASGIVTQKRVAVGDYLKEGEPLFDLMSLEKVWVLFDAYEEDLSNIRIGDQIEFNTPSIPNKNFKTKITFIDPMIDPTTRVAYLRTEINNTNGLLKPEMFVNGLIQKNRKGKTKLTVPKTAVLWTGTRSVVYVKVPDTAIPSYQFREVELGDGLGDAYQLISGLEAGEEVVTYGSFTIDAAAQLNNQASMMNQNVTVKKEAMVGVPNYQAVTPVAFQEQLNELANQYIELKTAFVATDAKAAVSQATGFTTELEKVDQTLLKGEAQNYWMEQLAILKTHGEYIANSEEVEKQRKQFGFVSDALIQVIEAFGTSGEALYVQHCPMAFNNQGGDWIAREAAIQNPYFGDKMMRCGLVKKTFGVEE